MADLDRRTVKPAHPDAYIPDPDRREKLPAEGREVIWSHYWEGHLAKGNIVLVEAEKASDPTPDANAAPAQTAAAQPPKAAPAPAPAADATPAKN